MSDRPASDNDDFLSFANARELYPSTMLILDQVSSQWPEHTSFIRRRFANDNAAFMARSEILANDILQLTNDKLAEFCANYRWMCDQFVKEELFFRRNKRYRLSTLKEARESVYDNPDFMERYMSGLLISQVLWRNHTSVIDSYITNFLGACETPFRHLEVGPGHGLFLHRAATHQFCKAAHGWDISKTSLQATAAALSVLNSDSKVRLEHRDVASADAAGADFDTVVISEVLEHVEQPDAVLEGLVRVIHPGGRIFLNVPVNSPAPDHIYLWRTPEDVVSLVSAAGLDIIETHLFPATGVTLEQARKAEITISTVITAQRKN